MTPIRIARLTAIANLALLGLAAVAIGALRVAFLATRDADLRWLVLPIVMLYFLVGGILWVAGLVSSGLARRSDAGEAATKWLLLGQSYPLVWAALAAWSAVNLMARP